MNLGDEKHAQGSPAGSAIHVTAEKRFRLRVLRVFLQIGRESIRSDWPCRAAPTRDAAHSILLEKENPTPRPRARRGRRRVSNRRRTNPQRCIRRNRVAKLTSVTGCVACSLHLEWELQYSSSLCFFRMMTKVGSYELKEAAISVGRGLSSRVDSHDHRHVKSVWFGIREVP